MSDTFKACTLPWSIGTDGLTLTHSDGDVSPHCSVEFGALVVRPEPPYEALWVRVEFAGAAFASAKPHRDDEELADVTGYIIGPRGENNALAIYEENQAEWLRSGLCPDPSFYFSTETQWKEAEKRSWAERQRGTLQPEEAVHFLLDGRDGYIEILAAGFTWRAWHRGHPLHSDVSGDPVMSGLWANPAADR